MKINYRLEIEYKFFPKNRNPFTKIDNYIFNSDNSIQNREDALNKLESFEHVFELSSKKTNHMKMSIIEALNEDEINDFRIPNVNLFYSLDNFSKENDGILLYGNLLESFEERMKELIEEKELYEKLKVKNYKTEIILDKEHNKYIVLKNSPINEIDIEKIK